MMTAFISLIVVLLACIVVLDALASSCNYSSQFCGDLPIPYPFGMSPDCGLPDQFRISCKRNSSFGSGQLPFLQIGARVTNELQVLNFSTSSVIVNSTHLKASGGSNPNCSNRYFQVTPDLGDLTMFELPDDGPFVLAANNLFVAIGCHATGFCNVSRKNTSKIFHLSCKSECFHQYAFPFCNSRACCVTAFPPGTGAFNFTGNGSCGFTSVLTPDSWNPTADGVVGDNKVLGAGQYGLDLSWSLESKNCSSVQNTEEYACADHSQCVDVSVDFFPVGYVCNCSAGFRGDGYKNGLGCEDIDECKENLDNCAPPPLGTCTNTDGSFYCNCTSGVGSGIVGDCTASAQSVSKVSLVAVGVAAALVMLLLVLLVLGWRRRRNLRRRRRENFKRNGGDGLLEQISTFGSHDSGRRRLHAQLFTPDELKTATKNFSEHLKLGSGAFGTVYKGELTNPHIIVAIKKAKDMQQQAVAQFINEILLLGQVDHPNIVRLLGCCLHTEVPLLVYEYIDNGTLSECLEKARNGTKQLSWGLRLHIAVQSAEGLAHLHDASPPILHRDIKSANILLDRVCTPKIADFGASNFLPSGHTHLSVDMLVFTMGYLDPEYYTEFRFTDKSDVYSFGVVLLELITARPAFLGTPLVQLFFTSLQMGNFEGLIDQSLIAGADAEHVMASIQEVVKIVSRCLETEGRQRPTMGEARQQLGKIESKFRKATREIHEELGTTLVGSEYMLAMETDIDGHVDQETSSLLDFQKEHRHLQIQGFLDTSTSNPTTSTDTTHSFRALSHNSFPGACVSKSSTRAHV